MGQQIASALRESMHRVLFKLASFLPGLLALLLAVVVLAALGAEVLPPSLEPVDFLLQ